MHGLPTADRKKYEQLLKKFEYKWMCTVQTHVVQGATVLENLDNNQIIRTFTNLRLHLDKHFYSYP